MSDERKVRLAAFVEWVGAHITGDEKGQAQIFLDRFFQALGHRGCLEVGGTPEYRVRKPKESGGGVSYADYVWKPYVLIEMKKRGADLHRHYRQAFDYWTRLVPGRPRYVILCNFDEFWVYDFETQMDTPVDQVALAELPQRYGPLAFLFPSHEHPVFGNDHEQVTRDAADRLATCFNKLIARRVPRDVAQRFTLQMLVALFAEDIGLLERYFVARLLEECKEPTDSYELLGGLFEAMNSPDPATGGRFKEVDYFNGGLFEQPAKLDLYDDELNQLRRSAKFDWSKVRPEIFGTLFEHSLAEEERHAYGGHFTRPTDIMKIVGPTIVEPWRNLIENASNLDQLEKLRHRMHSYRVLDPACGSGNFLYIAYRELKRLEARIFERIAERKKVEKGQQQIGFVTASQFYGIDINPFAVEIAKVTMMIARKLAIDELHVHEPALPLDNLDGNFVAGDALITPVSPTGETVPSMLFAEMEGDPWATGKVIPTPWPEADVIIGNPPFLGAKRLKPERGPDYLNAVRRTYPDVPGMADYCVYWFRRAHDHLPECTTDDPVAGRAGLVGTQNIRNNKSRVGGLDHIVKSGTIIEAVDNQPWSGDANVHVSIVNWIKTQDKRLVPKKRRLWIKVNPEPGKKKIRKKSTGPAAKEYELAFRDCPTINPDLSDQTDVTNARVLSCNTSDHAIVCQGVTPGHSGFVLNPSEKRELTAKDPDSESVIFPYLVGREMLSGDGTPTRYVIDFGRITILQAKRFSEAFAHVESHVLPDVQRKADEAHESDRSRSDHLQRWWLHWRARRELIDAVNSLPRFLICSRVTKRPVFAFIENNVRPGDALQCFAYADDYSFGVLQSNAHWQWFVAKCSKLKSDFRYTPESVFDTFAWPQSPSAARVRVVAEAGREVRRVRGEALENIKGGLRAVYRTLELPGKNPLKDAHAALDKALLAAYGFDAKKNLLQQLLGLNLSVAERIDRSKSVTAPGIPPDYSTPDDLITEDCIRPLNRDEGSGE